MATDPEYSARLIRAALALVTDNWNDQSGSTPFDATELARVIEDDELSDQELVIGLMSMCNILLVKAERSGQSPSSILADIGTRYGAP